LLQDSDTDSPGFYTVLAGAFNGWQGGALYVDAAAASVSTAYGLQIVTAASGSSWEAVAASMVNVPHGVAGTALSPAMNGAYWDRLSSIIVTIFNAMDLQSAAEADCLIQPLNATWIGGEVVQYANAASLGNNMWKLTTFLRGLRGTERLIGGHAAGESFVRLTSGLNRVLTIKSELNITDSFQALTNMSPNTSATPFSFTDTGNSLRPYTPAIFGKNIDAEGNFNFGWWPRVRTGGQWLDGSDVTLPANDTPETYEVDVLNAPNGTVLRIYSFSPTAFVVMNPDRTVVSTTAGNYVLPLGVEWSYTVALQTSDYGSQQTKVYFAVYQISTIVGRGFGIGVTI